MEVQPWLFTKCLPLITMNSTLLPNTQTHTHHTSHTTKWRAEMRERRRSPPEKINKCVVLILDHYVLMSCVMDRFIDSAPLSALKKTKPAHFWCWLFIAHVTMLDCTVNTQEQSGARIHACFYLDSSSVNLFTQTFIPVITMGWLVAVIYWPSSTLSAGSVSVA